VIPSAAPDSLLIIVPALNEEAAIGGVVTEIRQHVPGVRVLVIDDCSSDSTIAVARQAGAEILPMPHHLGLGGSTSLASASGPQIHHGADDNASGVAGVLAVARAFASLKTPPARSVYFAFVAGEEQGLLGSEWLVKHPPVPAGRIAANVNVDGIGFYGKTRDIGMIGLGKSSLDADFVALAGAQGRTVHGDESPEKGSFYRSDQFNFARAGVPAAYVKKGTDVVGRPPGYGKAQEEALVELGVPAGHAPVMASRITRSQIRSPSPCEPASDNQYLPQRHPWRMRTNENQGGTVADYLILMNLTAKGTHDLPDAGTWVPLWQKAWESAVQLGHRKSAFRGSRPAPWVRRGPAPRWNRVCYRNEFTSLFGSSGLILCSSSGNRRDHRRAATLTGFERVIVFLEAEQEFFP